MLAGAVAALLSLLAMSDLACAFRSRPWAPSSFSGAGSVARKRAGFTLRALAGELDGLDGAPSVMLCRGGRQLVFDPVVDAESSGAEGEDESTVDQPVGRLLVAWQDADILSALKVRVEEDPLSETLQGDSGATAVSAVVLSDAEAAEDPLFVAVDVSALPEEAVLRAVRAGGSEGAFFLDTRPMMVQGEPASLMDCGRARALLSWHAANKFCGRCGGPTVSVEGGAKRLCADRDNCGHRMYPRTDPVAIMLVHDAGADRCLLGRSKRFRPGMYTCLSGFVEPCEPLESAVRREVYEESGVDVGRVEFVASQPWPAGRGGTCELMLGCFAEAQSTQLVVDTSEMEDVRWFTREEVRLMHEASTAYANDGGQPPEGVLWVPGSYAVAHHLVAEWLSRGAPEMRG